MLRNNNFYKLNFFQLIKKISLNSFLIFILFYIYTCNSFAIDLGINSRVWDINEVDLKQLIAEDLHEEDANEIQINYKNQVKHFGENLTPNQLPIANETSTIYFDPSVSLTKDIIINGTVIYKKGTFVNPLKVIRPNQYMLFFDGKNQEQTAFALEALKTEPYRIMLVMTDGNPIKLAHQIHHPVFYAYQNLINRFHIAYTPTLLGVGIDSHEDELAITTFSKPYSIGLLKKCWNGCLNIKNKVNQHA